MRLREEVPQPDGVVLASRGDEARRLGVGEQIVDVLAVPDARGQQGAGDDVEDLDAWVRAGDADERVRGVRIAGPCERVEGRWRVRAGTAGVGKVPQHGDVGVRGRRGPRDEGLQTQKVRSAVDS